MEDRIDIASMVNNPELTELLNGRIKKYNKREAEEGGRLKRTPLDSIRDQGNLNANYLIDEFIRIVSKKSNLPRAQRDEIISFVGETMHTLYLNQQRRKANGNQEESGSESPNSK